MNLPTKKVPFDVYIPATINSQPLFVETIEVEVYENFGYEFITTESSILIEETRSRHMKQEMILEVINKDNLRLAIKAVKKIFPYEMDASGRMSMEEAYVDSINDETKFFAYYLAKVNGRVVGVTGHYLEEDGRIWLGWFGVIPSERRKGYGSAILKETCNIVSSLGFNEMMIYSGDRTEERRAHDLYISHGFKKTGTGEVAGEPVLFFKGPV